MFIVIDVGGTSTRVASSKDGKTILKKERFSTPQDFEEGVSSITKAVKNLVGQKQIQGVAIGVPGTIDHRNGRTIRVPNIRSWDGIDVSYIFQSKLGVPVRVVNDAELAALGEAVFGAGKQHSIVAYITVSTGVGGALVADKRLVPSAYNREPGQITVDPKGERSPRSGHIGTLEMHASGTAFRERFGLEPKDCDDPKIWRGYAAFLGEGIINVLLLWSPEILIIGGGLSRAGDLLFDPLRKFIDKNLMMFPPPPIVPAELGDDAGLYGGLVLLK
jgi:glucokinase